ncbi:MAG: Translocator protein, LysE family [candidate division TM6 bacterium GW2011_GWF2_38_10]|nr:MAG: Translocator protein, LysE family [candidate division TM6 bacterium GW2011_GWF2_38_10]
MNFNLYLKCFFIGLSVASAVGPIFVLTFNNAVWYGFSRGFATALGASLGDGLLFFLGLLGVLRLLGEYQSTLLVLDLLGGILLIALALRSFKGRQKYIEGGDLMQLDPISLLTKSFFLTIANPLTVLFFMFIGVRILPSGIHMVPFRQLVFGSFFAFLGSLSILSSVSLIASHLGNAINQRTLKIVSYVTGTIFLLIGIYFSVDFVSRLIDVIDLL